MNILVDCGAHDGENFSWFFNRYKNPQECRIFGFEPNPEKTFCNNGYNLVYEDSRECTNKNNPCRFIFKKIKG